jgi:hydrogenase-4 component E
MNVLVIIVFAITLIYFSVTERFRIYVNLITTQGLLLFALSFLELERITLTTLLFVATETLLFKVIVVPSLLYRIIKKTGEEKVHERAMPGFYSLLFVSMGLILSIVVSFSLKTTPGNLLFFIVSFFAIYTGLFLIISHKKVFSHLVGFLVVENAVLLLSMAIGSQIPMLINIGILLDIFVSVLILGIFVMRVKQHTSELTMLKDD